MKSNNDLFELISSSFGLDGKTVKIVNTRRTSDGTYNISDINYTKDGKSILASYCDQYRDDPDAFAIFEEVYKFEKNYGDGTSLLTMLLTYLTSSSKVTPFTEEEIDRDIDYIISLIEDSSLDDILHGENIDLAFKHWLMTVCKSDKIYKPLFEFYKSKTHANIKSIRKTESFDKNEIIFKPRSGFTIASRIHSTYLNPSYSKYRDLKVVVTKMRLDADTFKAFEEQAYQKNERLVFLCTEITDECEKAINESKSERIIAIRYSPDQLDNVYRDLMFMFNKEPDNNSIIIGNIREIKIQENSITLYGFERTSEELIEYCNALVESFEESEENDREILNVRIANIISDNTFDILLNTLTLRRYKMLHGMVEDVAISRKHFPKGLIVGGMHYITKASPLRSSQIIKIVKEIYNRLHKGHRFTLTKTNFLKSIYENDKNQICTPVDLKENAIQIFETVRSYLKELAGTSNQSILTKAKWHGA